MALRSNFGPARRRIRCASHPTRLGMADRRQAISRPHRRCFSSRRCPGGHRRGHRSQSRIVLADRRRAIKRRRTSIQRRALGVEVYQDEMWAPARWAWRIRGATAFQMREALSRGGVDKALLHCEGDGLFAGLGAEFAPRVAKMKRDGRDRDLQLFGDIAIRKSGRKPFQALRFALAKRATELRSKLGMRKTANNPHSSEIFSRHPSADGTQA